MTIFQYISLLWTRFTPLEKRLLAEVRAVLPEAARPIFDAQVSAVTKSQRVLKWNEICYYRIKRWKVSWSDVPLFPCTDEMELAEVRFKAAGKQFKATLGSVAGHIFDFRLQPGGRSVAFALWEDTPRTRLLDDPMRQSTGRRNPAALLPAWVDFVKRHENAQSGVWTLYNGDTAYSVSLETGEFRILAEREGDEFVLQRLEPPSDQLYYLESHDGIPEPLSKDLESVIKDEGQQLHQPDAE
jgi:hypothetical protein